MSLLLLFNSTPSGPSTVSGSLTADAVLLRAYETPFTADAVLLTTIAGSLSADSQLLAVSSGTFTADSVLFATVANSATADAVLFKETSVTFTADAELALAVTTETGDFTADSVLVIVGTPHWTTPIDNAQITENPVLAFTIPQATGPMHFHMQFDRVDTFDSVDLIEHDSSQSTTDWEYWDGDSWEPIPIGGVDEIYAGNEARLTLTAPLASGEWFRRVRAGV